MQLLIQAIDKPLRTINRLHLQLRPHFRIQQLIKEIRAQFGRKDEQKAVVVVLVLERDAGGSVNVQRTMRK